MSRCQYIVQGKLTAEPGRFLWKSLGKDMLFIYQ